MRLLFNTLLVIFLFVSSPALASSGLLDIQEVQSESGLTAWLAEDHSVPVIAMELSWRGGGAAFDPQDKQGLARMVSNTMDEGAGQYSGAAFQQALRDYSIDLRFNAGRDSFGVSLKTLTKNKDKAYELLKLALTMPRFDSEAVERMRKANESRVRSSMTDPEWMAARLLNDKAFEGHPYAMNSGGTLSGLATITPEDLKKFYKTVIGKNNLVIAVSGDITADHLKALLDELFKDLPEITVQENEDLELQNAGKTFFHAADVPQTVIEIIQPGMARNDPDYHKAQVMNFILGSSGFGSRLTEEIREKRGLTYGIYSGLQNLDHAQSLSISTSTATKNVPEIITLIKAELKKIINEPVSDQELADAKSYLIGSLPLSLTSTDAIAALLLSLQLDHLPINYLDQRQKAIEQTRIEDVQNVAATLLKPDALTTILIGKEPIEGAETVEILPNVE